MKIFIFIILKLYFDLYFYLFYRGGGEICQKILHQNKHLNKHYIFKLYIVNYENVK